MQNFWEIPRRSRGEGFVLPLEGSGLSPGWGTKIPQAVAAAPKNKTKQKTTFAKALETAKASDT